MIHDLDFVCPDDIDIALPVAPAGLFNIHLEGGISTRLYLSMLKYRWKMTENQRNDEALEKLKDIALKIIREDRAHSDLTSDYFDTHLNHFTVLKALVSTVYQAMGELANQPGLTLPQIMVSREKVVGTDEQEIMKDIAFVMAHTANTYKEIMDMPYVTFACLLKNLVLSEALKDPEYREAYEKYQQREVLKKRREAIKNGKIVKQKLDIEGLKRFAASL